MSSGREIMNMTNTSHLVHQQDGDREPSVSAESLSPFDSLQDKLTLVFFSLIVVVSFCGNLLVCRTLLRQKPFCSNSTKVLIGVLAVSDLMMTIFNIPFTLVDIILKDWIFGEFFCTLVSFVQANSVYVSSFTMAVIAINRWSVIYKFQPKDTPSPSSGSNGKRQALVTQRTILSEEECCCSLYRYLARGNQQPSVNVELHADPLSPAEPCPALHNNVALLRSGRDKRRLQPRTRLGLTVLAIWIMAALHSLPHTVFNQVKTIRARDAEMLPDALHLKRRCVTVPPAEYAEHYSLFLTIFTTLTQYFVPLSCAGVIYTRIGFTIMAQGRVGEMSSTRAKQLTQKKRRRLLMLILIVVIFAFCWLPFNVYYLLLDSGVIKSSNYPAFLVCLWVACTSVCYNPFVYCWLNEDFQREAKLVLSWARSLCRL